MVYVIFLSNSWKVLDYKMHLSPRVPERDLELVCAAGQRVSRTDIDTILVF